MSENKLEMEEIKLETESEEVETEYTNLLRLNLDDYDSDLDSN